MVYKTKRDIFHYILYSIFSGIYIMFFILVAMEDTSIVSKISTIILFSLIEAYFTVIMFFTSFYFTKDKLICKIGPLELGYLYDNIKEIRECNSISLYVNVSIKCIKIKNIDSKSIKISPQNKEEFLKELSKHGFLVKQKKVSDNK